jgi:hypothetical protein
VYATEVDCLIDYLAHKHGFEKEWDIIYRKAQGRNLFGTLFLECSVFLVIYPVFLFGTRGPGANYDLKLIIIFWIIVFLMTVMFAIVTWRLSKIIEIYDRRIIKNFKLDLLTWAEEELG